METTTTRMAADNPIDELLRNCACVDFDQRAADAIREACRRQQDWEKVIREAELHGLAPYLHTRVSPGWAGRTTPRPPPGRV